MNKKTLNEMSNEVYAQMFKADVETIAKKALDIGKKLNDDTIGNQLMTLAATLVCVRDLVGLNIIDILGMAECMVYSGEFNNMLPEFKKVQKLNRIEEV